MIDKIKKFEIKGSSKILSDLDNRFVYKKSSKDILSLQKYLESRNFNKFVKANEKTIYGYEYPYIENVYTPKEQKLVDIINILAELHTKTSYFKDVGEDKYLEIIENINDNILYIEKYYDSLIVSIESNNYFSPSQNLIAINYSKILGAINYCKNELEEYKVMVIDKDKQRVCTVHNNINVDHLLKNEKDYLISWDNFITDTPVMDLYKLFQNENISYEFKELLNIYEKKYKLLEDEKKLLFILLSIPKKFLFTKNEYNNTVNVTRFFEYLDNANNLVSSYDSKDSNNK